MKEKQIEVYKKNIISLVAKAESFDLKTKDDMDVAVSLLSQLNKYADNVQKKKEALTKPLNLALKNIRAMFKEVEEKYEEGIENLRMRMSVYQTSALKRQKEEEEKIAEKIAEGKISIEKAVEKLEDVNITEKIETKDGDVKFITVNKFEVMDLTLLPIEYHVADEVKIRKAYNEGIQLPGVRYWEEQSVRNYR